MARAVAALIESGGIAWLAIGLIGAEVVALLALAAKRPSLNRRAIVANGLSGAFLMLALRAALLGQGPMAVALWISLGLLAHGADVAARLRG